MRELKWGMTPEQLKDWKRAFAEGRSAKERGLSYHQCPYDHKDQVNRSGWVSGWKSV